MSKCLMLHGIGEPLPHVTDEEKPYWVSEALFAATLDLVTRISAEITIDDGNASDATIALPALLRAGLKAAFFIPSDRIGRPGFLGEDDILRLHREGMEVGSHGSTHVCWTSLSDGEIARDVIDSIERLSTIIGAPVTSVAIPFGACDRRVLGILRSLGIRRAYSSFRGLAMDGAWLVRRDCIMRDMSVSDVDKLLIAEPASVSATVRFLRVWRRAGSAALLKA